MRLYSAESLKEYIDQLKLDIVELDRVWEKYDNGIYSNEILARIDRDSYENHVNVLNNHIDKLRRARNAMVKPRLDWSEDD